MIQSFRERKSCVDDFFFDFFLIGIEFLFLVNSLHLGHQSKSGFIQSLDDDDDEDGLGVEVILMKKNLLRYRSTLNSQ